MMISDGGRLLRTMIIISISITLILTSFPISASSNEETSSNLSSSDISSSGALYPSLDGDHGIEDIAYSSILGDDTNSPQGKLGSFTGHTDVNDDGFEDLVISAPLLYSDGGQQHSGVCYIFYGNETLQSGDIDLKFRSPDITIKGTSEGAKLLSDISTGDLNSDGYVDIALGMVSQGDTGKVYILWGEEGGWDPVISLYQAANAEPNGNPFGVLRRDTFAVISGYVTMVVEGTKLGKNVIIDDIDNDGHDDLIFSYHGWNKVIFVWGGHSKGEFASDYSFFDMDPQDIGVQGDFGSSVETCDLDNDGWRDLVVGAPLLHDEERLLTHTGGVFVYYNISFIRGNRTLTPDIGVRPLITGRDPYDNFGTKIVIHDINGDDFDDILVGTPNSNGPNNDNKNVGQIMVYLGGNITKFPSKMYAEERYHLMIVGEGEKDGDYPGDKIGTSFDVGDIDGDNEPELILGLPGRIIDEQASRGSVIGYDDIVAFPDLGGLVDLSRSNKKFKIDGMEAGDVLGYSVSLLDLNGDTSDDLFIGSPSSDGTDNLRPGCGEVHHLPGFSSSILGMEISGPAVEDGKVLPGFGNFFLTITYRNSLDPFTIDSLKLILEPTTVNSTLVYSNDGFSALGPSVVKLDTDNCTTSFMGDRGVIRFSLSLSWHSLIGRDWDIKVIVCDQYGRSLERDYRKWLSIVNEIIVEDDHDLFVDGRETMEGEWQTPGSTMTINGINVHYKDFDNRNVPEGVLTMVLRDDLGNEESAYYEGPSTDIDVTIMDRKITSYTLNVAYRIEDPEPSLRLERPGIRGKISFTIRTDKSTQASPQGLMLEPDEGRTSIYDDDTNWAASWGMGLDSPPLANTSGIRSYVYRLDESKWNEVKVPGGLWGTYYNGSDFQQEQYGQLDPELGFGDSDWGSFGPDPDLLTPSQFSVRWHGWINFDTNRNYQFSMAGDGHAKLVLDDEVIIDWSDITKVSSSDLIFIDEGSLLPVTIYYFNDDGSSSYPPYSSFHLRYKDERGFMVPLETDRLFYPGNRTFFEVEDRGSFDLDVAYVDWTSRISPINSISGYIDRSPPVFDLSGISAWYASIEPSLDLMIRDPDLQSVPGSGLDTNSIEYRIMKNEDDSFSEWIIYDGVVDSIKNGTEGPPLEISISIDLTLGKDWKGSIQFMTSDAVGNTAISSILDIGIDLHGPTFDLLSPNILISQMEGDIDLLVRAVDRPGVGVDGTSIEMRIGNKDHWQPWRTLNITGSGEEMVFGHEENFEVGLNYIQYRTRDLLGNTGLSEVYKILTDKKVIDQAPVPRIGSPLNGTEVFIGLPVELDGSASSDDGLGTFPSLRFTWISNTQGYLGSGETVTVYLKDPGEHRIRLYLDDGSPGHNVSTDVYLIAKEYIPDNVTGDHPMDPEHENYLIPVLVLSIVIVLLFCLIILLFYRNSKKIEDTVLLEFVERTEDDREYDDMTTDEKRSMGILLEKPSRTNEELEKEKKDLYG